MAASQLQCWECRTTFYGRADARYCCGGCRQKAHRKRVKERTADESAPAPAVHGEIARAWVARTEARAARARAKATCRDASELLAGLSRPER